MATFTSIFCSNKIRGSYLTDQTVIKLRRREARSETAWNVRWKQKKAIFLNPSLLVGSLIPYVWRNGRKDSECREFDYGAARLLGIQLRGYLRGGRHQKGQHPSPL